MYLLSIISLIYCLFKHKIDFEAQNSFDELMTSLDFSGSQVYRAEFLAMQTLPIMTCLLLQWIA